MNGLSTILMLLLLIVNLSDCQQTINLFNNNFYVSLTNDGTQTTFYVTTPFGNKLQPLIMIESLHYFIFLFLGNGVSPTNAWLAVGFNNNPKMLNTNAVICRYSTSSSFVRAYYNPIYFIPQLVQQSNPSFGLQNPVSY